MMMKAWFLRLHRWLALIFAVPLIVVLVTGLILSFEPALVTAAIKPGTLNADKIQSILDQHDPNKQARAISFRAYDGTLTLGAGRGGGAVIDVATGAKLPGPSVLASLLGMMRGLHETLLLNATWLVVASTFAMLVIILLGILMGLPRIANTLSGWHKAMAWGLLPLIVLSPLSGLLMYFGVTLIPASNPPVAAAPAPRLADAVKVLGQEHDLSTLIWLRPMGGRMVARLAEGEYRLYAVSPTGATLMPRNWPRLWHEGNFAGIWSAAMNVIISFAMTGLLVTGIWIWIRRRMWMARRRAEKRAGLA